MVETLVWFGEATGNTGEWRGWGQRCSLTFADVCIRRSFPNRVIGSQFSGGGLTRPRYGAQADAPLLALMD